MVKTDSGSIAMAVATLLMVGLAAPATAQQPISIEGHGGVGFPAGALLDLQNSGPAFGASGTYWLTERVGIRAGGDVQLFSGKEGGEISNVNGISTVPDFTTFHFHGGLDVRVSPPEETSWDVRVNLGAGGASLTTEEFPSGATPPADASDFSETVFALNTGLRLGYAPTDRLNLFVLGQGLFAFTDEQEMNVFTQFDEGLDPNSISSVWSVPLQAGVEYHF